MKTFVLQVERSAIVIETITIEADSLEEALHVVAKHNYNPETKNRPFKLKRMYDTIEDEGERLTGVEVDGQHIELDQEQEETLMNDAIWNVRNSMRRTA